MNYLQRLEHWGDTHHSKWMDSVRIALGIFLCIKGVEFAQNMSNMMSLMKNMPFSSFMLVLISHFIIAAHIMGGVLITLGMLTRFACIIQIPILLGAIIFVSSSGDIMKPFSELLIAVLVLAALIYFLIIGSGPWSWDALSEKEK